MVMRVSTGMLQGMAARSLVDQQSELVRIQRQLSTGKRILSPADDPVATTRIATITGAQEHLARYRANQTVVKNETSIAESTIGSVEDVLQRIRELLVQAGNAAYDGSNLRAISTEMAGLKGELVSLANTRDPEGGYIFAGYGQDTQPFVETVTGATYNGDQGTRTLQVTPTRTLMLAENGTEVFERIRRGNGTFETGPASGNTGSGVIDRGTVIDRSLINDHSYAINFTVSAGRTTYAVVDTTTATTLSSGNAYTSGTAVNINGMQVSLSGRPASGDSFTLRPSRNQSVFTAIGNAITTLESVTPTAAGQVRFANELASNLADMDQALDHFGVVRGRFGVGLAELESLASSSDDLDVAYAKELSGLQDIDYAKTISEFLARQQALQAAQESYAKLAQRSLFDSI